MAETVLDGLGLAAVGLSEAASQTLAGQIRQAPVEIADKAVNTTYVCQGSGQPPLLLLHGFDSSVLEFRRLLPQLAPLTQSWALDLLGFGFTDRMAIPNITPKAIKGHLVQFWRQQIKRPVVLVGASMGGAVAIDVALSHPEAVIGLVLVDSAGFAAAPAMEKLMRPPLDRWATAFLRNSWVRRKISQNAYYDRALVTPDAELCAALHLECEGWSDALIAFTKSGGYNNFLEDKIARIQCPTLVIWGARDRILGRQDAYRFQQAIAHSRLVWIPDCGHVPHLECPQVTAAAISEFFSGL